MTSLVFMGRRGQPRGMCALKREGHYLFDECCLAASVCLQRCAIAGCELRGQTSLEPLVFTGHVRMLPQVIPKNQRASFFSPTVFNEMKVMGMRPRVRPMEEWTK